MFAGMMKKYRNTSSAVIGKREEPNLASSGMPSAQIPDRPMHRMKLLRTERIRSDTAPQKGWETMFMPLVRAVIRPICPAPIPSDCKKTLRKFADAKQQL